MIILFISDQQIKTKILNITTIFENTYKIFFAVDETLGNVEAERTLWLDTQSHASSSVSSDTPESDCNFSWPTSFWTQFKVSYHEEFYNNLKNFICIKNLQY